MATRALVPAESTTTASSTPETVDTRSTYASRAAEPAGASTSPPRVTTASIGGVGDAGKSARIVSATTRLPIPSGRARSSMPPNWICVNGSAIASQAPTTTTE